MHPLLDSDPAQRTPAREETPAAEALAWLKDPQPPPPPLSSQDSILREICEAIGWPLEQMQEAITELNEYDPQKRRKAYGVPRRRVLVGGVTDNAWYRANPV